MRARGAALVLVAVTACGGLPVGSLEQEARATISVRPLGTPTAPSPYSQVQAGHITALIPGEWDARPLSALRFPQEGFVASPRIDAWERGRNIVQGMEAFWIDVGKLEIPSDYYYLAAQSPHLGSFSSNEACEPQAHEVIVDRPPDVTGAQFSPGDYVARASGVCHGKQATRWAYVVVAPGFGPVREVGIPNSGLYVVVAVVSGHRAEAAELLDRMVQEATFGDAQISDFMEAARRVQ
jgi:hypothetical protein